MLRKSDLSGPKGDREAGCPLRRDAILRVSHVPDGHTAGEGCRGGAAPRAGETRRIASLRGGLPMRREMDGGEAEGLEEARLSVTSGEA